MNEVSQRHLASTQDRTSRASAMKAVLVNSQFTAGVFIAAQNERDNAIIAASKEDPLYSSMGAEVGARQALSDASAIRQYSAENNGAMPSDDLLAAAHGTLENLFSNNQVIAEDASSGMLLSSVSESNLSTEQGVIIRATTAALTLPTMLSNPMNDIVAYLPVRKNKTEIFLIDRVAGKTLGDFTKNQVIDELTAGQYSHQRQRYIFDAAQSPDGTKTVFNFDTAAHTPALTKLPFKNSSVKVYFNRDSGQALNQLDDGSLYGSVTVGGSSVVMTGVVDSDLGKIVVTAGSALPDGAELHAEFEIDIESNPDLIPTIDHKMRSFTIRPASRVISADASIMSVFTMQTEFGVDTNSLNLSSMRNVLVDERSKKQLEDLMFFVQEERSFDAEVPTDTHETWATRFEYIKSLFLSISQSMINKNKRSGMKGMYAGTEFSTFVKMLPPSIFTMAPNYTQEPRIHFIGTLMGGIKVFEVPYTSIVPADKALAYARPEQLGYAPYYTGDVIPPTLYSQEVTKGLRKGSVIWANGYDSASPEIGTYLTLITLTNFTAG
jgi:hypothetical protein